ncbi:undecaprenyl-diphosphate phosphatase [Tsuneonella rigui]|jgi:undecaprenyl-diphosphatase|uniref:undecaprenyl-diphosphate phosphatase n=1 Tax=Tsuneonella rigui TaxID=1708790 RepID=UPI000F7F6A62|nr:undecaprenyl-diphosphate phosphatase [Tsuneonella rigui]
MGLILTAILLGIVEGLTEFIPVSSTGHLILASELFGYDAGQWAMFNVVIQLGAILAVVYQYFGNFWSAGMGFIRREPAGLLFVRNLLLAFLPSAVLGLALKDYIDVMLESPEVVCWALIAGGIAILIIERRHPPAEIELAEGPREGDDGVADLSFKTALGVGLAQCLSMVPGVSRSGATIMGALAMGVPRKTAAEFSFFLAIPTMLGATALSLFQHGDELATGASVVGWTEIAVGFAVSFVVALIVIRAFVAYVSRRGFAPFAWYRIVLGAVALVWLALR